MANGIEYADKRSESDFLKTEIQRIKLRKLLDPKKEQVKKIKWLLANGEC